MVAVVEVDFDKAGTVNAPGTPDHAVANLRFNIEDTNDQDTNSPITIPAAGTNYSYWKHIYLHCTTAPATQVNNVKIYTDGTLGWTGCTVKVGDDLCTKNSGSSAGYDPAVSAVVLTDHDTIITTTSLFTFTSGAPRTCTISEAGAIINATGELTDYVVLDVEVGTTGVQGTQTAETVTWQYDEI